MTGVSRELFSLRILQPRFCEHFTPLASLAVLSCHTHRHLSAVHTGNHPILLKSSSRSCLSIICSVYRCLFPVNCKLTAAGIRKTDATGSLTIHVTFPMLTPVTFPGVKKLLCIMVLPNLPGAHCRTIVGVPALVESSVPFVLDLSQGQDSLKFHSRTCRIYHQFINC